MISNFKYDDIEGYNEIKENRKAVLEELSELEKDEKIQRYLQLVKQNKYLQRMQRSVYKYIKTEEYSNCDHILVYSKIDYDKREGRTYKYCGCIKCGLNDAVLDESLLKDDKMSYKDKVMHDFLTENHIMFLTGRQLHIPCDLSLAQNIYAKIIENHPDIDELSAINYFDKALHNIRNIHVSEERKKSRAKRLSLKTNFDAWYSEDIVDNR